LVTWWFGTVQIFPWFGGGLRIKFLDSSLGPNEPHGGNACYKVMFGGASCEAYVPLYAVLCMDLGTLRFGNFGFKMTHASDATFSKSLGYGFAISS